MITVRKAYEELQRDGFIDTAVGRGSFVAERNREFYMEEQQRLAEEHLRQAAEIGLRQAAEIGRVHHIPLETLQDILKIFYTEEE